MHQFDELGPLPLEDLDAETFDAFPVGVAILAADATIVRANRMLGEMVGLTPEELVGRNMLEFGADSPERYAEFLDFGSGYTESIMGPVAAHYHDIDGRVRRTELWASNHLGRDLGAFVAVLTPEAARTGIRSALAAIARAEPVDTTLEHLAGALRGHPFHSAGCWMLADERRLVGAGDLSESVRAALHAPGPWWQALSSGSIVVCENTTATTERQRTLAAAGVQAWWAHPVRLTDQGRPGAAILVCRTGTGPPSPNQREHLEEIASTATVAFERADLEARLAHAAFHDPLTGVANRSRFFESSSGLAEPNTALLSIDLDRFKPVNDRYGHAAGDLVLVTVAERIRAAVRPTDRITRLGGDEFLVVCHGVENEREATAVASRIIHSIEQPISLSGDTVEVGASVGIAIAHDQTTLDDLLERSDQALYTAKDRGRGRWHVADGAERPDR